MTRQTSIDAYHANKDLLSQRRWEVYSILYKHGPLTSSELFEHYKKYFKPNFSYNMNVHSRLAELRACNVAMEVGKKECSIKNNLVILLDVTDKVAIKFEKPKLFRCAHCKGTGKIKEQQARLF